jgi:hypothetical protein
MKPVALLLLAFAAGGAACSSDDDDNGSTMQPGTCEGGGGPVTSSAAQEDHCAAGAQAVGMCVTSAEEAPAADVDEEHETNYGNEAADDDCKFHVSFTNTCIKLNEPVTFTLKLATLSDGKPATGAEPSHPEIYMDEGNHPSPSNRLSATEGPDGTYKIGPIVFDRSGRWVVRWHFFEDCSDVPEDSPHGHAAFYIDVP